MEHRGTYNLTLGQASLRLPLPAHSLQLRGVGAHFQAPGLPRQERWTSTASRSWTQPWRPATRRLWHSAKAQVPRQGRRRHAGHPGQGAAGAHARSNFAMYRGRQRLRGRHRHLPRHGLAGRLEHGANFLVRSNSHSSASRWKASSWRAT